MTNEEYDIQRQVNSLMERVLQLWKSEGKWDSNNPNAPFYGIEKDPLLGILISAFVYQMNGVKRDMAQLENGMMDTLEQLVMPYHLTQAVPAFTIIATGKQAADPAPYYVNEESTFLVKRESLRLKELFPFQPMFDTKIIGATVNSVTKIASDKWNVNLRFTDPKADLSNIGFFIEGVRFSDLNVYWSNEKINLIKPWEFERFPLCSWFSNANALLNNSLLFGYRTQWFDLWTSRNINYFMVDGSFDRAITSDAINLVFEFSDMVQPFNFDTRNLIINCFPAVNVIRKDFVLSPREPIVKLANEVNFEAEENSGLRLLTGKTPENNHHDFFMNLIADEELSPEDADKFYVRRFGCERFNPDELIRLANELAKRYESDFYAFQKIHQMQNADKIRRLDVVLKDILSIIKDENVPQSGVYAILKRNPATASSDPIRLAALFTDGAYTNDIELLSAVTPPRDLDKKTTRLLMKPTGGKDEVTDPEEKKMLARYYMQTNDRIVTKADLKQFCIRFFTQAGFRRGTVRDMLVRTELERQRLTEHVTLSLDKNVVDGREDMPMLISQLQKMVNIRSASVATFVLEFISC